ncbi:MAG TPA: DUF5069 domain-containing protein [Candidatus Cybelea sp.]
MNYGTDRFEVATAAKPFAELDGLMLLPRTIDKLRAQLPGGDPGVYYINGPIKGISGYLLDRLGISEHELREAVRRAASEDDVAAWVRERTDASQYPAINTTLRHIKPKHAEDEAWLRNEYAATIAEHPDLEFIIDILEADDKRRWAL